MWQCASTPASFCFFGRLILLMPQKDHPQKGQVVLILIRWPSWMHGTELIVEQGRQFAVAFFRNLLRAMRYILLMKCKPPFYNNMISCINIFASRFYIRKTYVVSVYSWLFASYLQRKIFLLAFLLNKIISIYIQQYFSLWGWPIIRTKEAAFGAVC